MFDLSHLRGLRTMQNVTLAVSNGDPYRTLLQPRSSYSVQATPETIARLIDNPALEMPKRNNRKTQQYIDCPVAQAAVQRGEFVLYSELACNPK